MTYIRLTLVHVKSVLLRLQRYVGLNFGFVCWVLPGHGVASHKTSRQSRCWTGWWAMVRIWSLNNTLGTLRKICRIHLGKKKTSWSNMLHWTQGFSLGKGLQHTLNYQVRNNIIIKHERLNHFKIIQEHYRNRDVLCGVYMHKTPQKHT